MTHIQQLRIILSHEKARLANAKTDDERAIRTVWVRQIEKEIAHEIAHGRDEPVETMTDDELLAALLQEPQQEIKR